MFVSGWKWYSGIKKGPLPSLAVCELSVSVTENPDRKKKNKKNKFKLRTDVKVFQQKELL